MKKTKPSVTWQAKYIRMLRRHEQMRKQAKKTGKNYDFLVNHDCDVEKCKEL